MKDMETLEFIGSLLMVLTFIVICVYSWIRMICTKDEDMREMCLLSAIGWLIAIMLVADKLF